MTNISEQMLAALQSRLRFKVQFHLGPWCPDIEDVLQETIVRLLRAQQDGVERTPETWAAFASATCNNVIHEYRRQLWRDTERGARTQEPRTGSGHVDAALDSKQLVKSVLTQLPDRDQEILRALYLDEKTVDQICAETGISRSHFAVALFRAKAKCRKKLQPAAKSAEAGNH